MIEKYRVHEVAKDLKIPSKEVIDLLGKYFPAAKKHMTALEKEELSVVFEHYTQQHSTDNLDSYFARAAERKPRAPKQAAPPPETPKVVPQEAALPAAQPPLPHQQAQQGQQGGRPTQGQQGQRVAQGQQTHRPAQGQQSQRPQQSGQQRPQNQRPQQGQQGGQQRPQVQRVHGKDRHQRVQARPQTTTIRPMSAAGGQANVTQVVNNGDAAVRVDMRGGKVNLDKYNERYETIAPTNLAKKDTGVRKQKINQKSAQRGKPFMSRKEQDAQKLKRLEMERLRRQKLEITLPESLSVSELASRLKIQAAEVVKRLMGLGIMAAAGEIIDYDTAAMVAIEIGAKVSPEVIVTIEDRLFAEDDDHDDNIVARWPVVVVMGHVDHGKTSLLDAIRKTNVTQDEAGGITQSIGAYQVQIHNKKITFLDTPGHEAFTSMRARGAQVTDIAVLVVAADDGIMPQTVEAINHAKAAGVNIIVAINKIDREDANPDRVKQGLTEYELVPEEWGGETICVELSAKTGQGIDQLLEMIQLVADMQELGANPSRPAKGTVIEARLDKGRGPIATILVQNGTLNTGDIIIAGTALGRVRAMSDDCGVQCEAAGPSTPVEITGLSEVPQAGDIFNAVEDERLARELVDQRRHEARQEQFKSYQKVTMENLFSQISEGNIKELPIIVKADVQGSVEALSQNLEKISNEEVRVHVIHGGVGAVSESDIMLANASNAIVVGFNVRPDPLARQTAEREGVDIRLYRVIYDAIDEITDAMKGMLAPKFRDVDLGRAEVRQVYKISRIGTVAGCYVLEGKITRAAKIRVVRDGIIVADDTLDSLRRFKEDVKEVATGYECGMGLMKFSDIKEGDVFEAYETQQYRD